METRVTETSSGHGRLIQIIESDEEVAERRRRRRAMTREARRQPTPPIATISGQPSTVTRSVPGNAAVQGGSETDDS